MNYDDVWVVFYRNQELIEYLDRAVYFFRNQRINRAIRGTGVLLKKLSETIPFYYKISDLLNEEYICMDFTYISDVLNTLLDTQEKKDYILLADMYELKLRPFIIDIQEKIISIQNGVPEYNRYLYRENYQKLKQSNPQLARELNEAKIPQRLLHEGYSVEYTSSGYVTVKVRTEDSEQYFHSNGNPMQEALQWAISHRIEERERLHALDAAEYTNGRLQEERRVQYEYLIFGFGFGYHIKALLEEDPYAIIHVFEADINLLQLACAYTDLGVLLEDSRVTVVYDPKGQKLSDEIFRGKGKLIVYHPSMLAMQKSYFKQRIENYFIQFDSEENQLHFLNGNFVSNLAKYDETVDVLKPVFKGKKLIIVAAGPSLDKNFKQLNNAREDCIILASSTVYIKLLEAGIHPDFVIVIDASDRVIFHVRKYADVNIPIIMLSTACKEYGIRYSGKKFLMFQKDYAPAERVAKLSGFQIYETGGSVATAALDLGIRMECSSIVFVGLDLSFPGQKAHADATSSKKVIPDGSYRMIEDVYGNMVLTNQSMDMYREWIEKRIAREGESGIQFIDATEGGAKILGTRIMKLSEVLTGRKRKKILIVKGKSKYEVMRRFAEQMAEGFLMSGLEVVIFDGNKNTKEQLLELAREEFDYIFSFNGVFSKVDLMADVIEQFEKNKSCTFLSFFVDHPCHHALRIASLPNHSISFFVDRTHIEDAKNINSGGTMKFLPHGGDVVFGRQKAWKERSIGLLFSGSRLQTDNYIENLPIREPLIQQYLILVKDVLLTDTDLTLNEGMQKVLEQNENMAPIRNIPKQRMEDLKYYIDKWVRSLIREKVIKALLDKGCQLAICGDGWESLQKQYPEQLTLYGHLSYEQALLKIQDAKILLNVLPWFKDGSHERVYTAMRSGAVCLTDESKYLKEELEEVSSVIFYRLNELDQLAGMVEGILSSAGEKAGDDIWSRTDFSVATDRAREYADCNHTWKKRAQRMLEMIDKELE